jgi:micrococcal nuclease
MMKALFSLFLFQFLLISLSTGQNARCLRVYDGDTYLLTIGGKSVKCRLCNVDAPEITQPYGKKCTDSVRALILNQDLLCVEKGKDKYGRLLVDLKIGGQSLDSILVARGWAWHYEKYSSKTYLRTLEVGAKRYGLGLWGMDSNCIIEPWRWREIKKKVRTIHFVGCD